MMIPMTMEMATAVENPSSSILVLFPTFGVSAVVTAKEYATQEDRCFDPVYAVLLSTLQGEQWKFPEFSWKYPWGHC